MLHVRSPIMSLLQLLIYRLSLLRVYARHCVANSLSACLSLTSPMHLSMCAMFFCSLYIIGRLFLVRVPSGVVLRNVICVIFLRCNYICGHISPNASQMSAFNDVLR